VLRPAATRQFRRDRKLAAKRGKDLTKLENILPLLDSGIAHERLSDCPTVRPSAFLYYVVLFVEGKSHITPSSRN